MTGPRIEGLRSPAAAADPAAAAAAEEPGLQKEKSVSHDHKNEYSCFTLATTKFKRQ